MTKKFPDNPFKPVTLHRLPYPVNTYPQPVACGVVWQTDQTEVLATHPFSLVVNQAVLPGLGQQPGLGEGIDSHAARRVLLVWPRNLDGQSLTAFGPATVDDRPPVLCLHSGPEAMGAVPFEVTGLKSSLAHDRLPFSLLLRPLGGPAFSFCCLAVAGVLRHALLLETSPTGPKNSPSNKAGYTTQSQATCQTFSRASNTQAGLCFFHGFRQTTEGRRNSSGRPKKAWLFALVF